MTANDDERSIRISGDLLVTTARAINAALVSIFPDARWEVSTEVAIETDAVDIAIYPFHRGGTDFLLTGNILLDDAQLLGAGMRSAAGERPSAKNLADELAKIASSR